MSKATQSPPAGDPILVVRDVQKHFGGIKAADGVSLEVGRREIAGLIGPNGSGKSTLFSLVSGTVLDKTVGKLVGQGNGR
jgi:branched-chain amino acid transport system ATP-binding protein